MIYFTHRNKNEMLKKCINLLCLSHSVAPVFSLFVIIRIKINVMNDDYIGRSQVNAQASCSCWQQEYEDFRFTVEPIN